MIELTKENIERVADKIKEIDFMLQEVKRDNLNADLEYRLALIGEELRLLYFEIKGFSNGLKTINENIKYFKEQIDKNDNS